MCVAKGGRAWRRGAMHGNGCMAKGGGCGEGEGMRGIHAPLYDIRPVNARAVRILLECILVQSKNDNQTPQYIQ